VLLIKGETGEEICPMEQIILDTGSYIWDLRVRAFTI
jgi:hypothetical protein